MRHGGIRDLKGKLVGMAGFRNPVQAPHIVQFNIVSYYQLSLKSTSYAGRCPQHRCTDIQVGFKACSNKANIVGPTCWPHLNTMLDDVGLSLLHISLLCALRIYLTTFDTGQVTQFGAFSKYQFEER